MSDMLITSSNFYVDDWIIDNDDLYLVLDDEDFYTGDPVKSIGKYSISTLKPYWAFNFFTETEEDGYLTFYLPSKIELSP